MASTPRSALKHRGPLVPVAGGFHLGRMSMQVTLIAMAILIALTALSGWRGAQPPNLVKGPRMVPWRAIMLGSGAFLLLFLVHLVNLAGFQTGR